MRHLKKHIGALLTALLCCLAAPGAEAGQLSLVPSNANPAIGDQVSLAVQLDSGTDLAGFQFDFSLQPASLELKSVVLSPGFERSVANVFDAGSGRGRVAAYTASPVSGAGLTLATITVSVRGSGNLPVTLTNQVLGDPAGEEIVSSAQGTTLSTQATGKPTLALTPASLSLGPLEVGQQTVQPLNLQNTGTLPLSVSGATVGTASGATVSLATGGANPCPSTTPTLQPGGSCTMALEVTPSALGAISAALTVASNDPDTPRLVVPLSATGVDGTAPVLLLSAIPDGESTTHQLLNIAGTVTDNLGVAAVTVNGQAVALVNGSFSHPFKLAPGANAITVSARDASGNIGSTSFTIGYDGTLPALAIMQPADGSVAAGAGITLTGTVAAGTTLKASLNGSPLFVPVTGNAFSLPLTLAAGQNTIVATVTDGQGRRSSAKRTVSYQPGGLDLSVAASVQDSMLYQPSITIKGSVGAGTEPYGVTLTLGDGTSFTPTLTGGAFEQVISAPSFAGYSIRASATDAAGKGAVVVRNLMRGKPGDYDGGGTVSISEVQSSINMFLGMKQPQDCVDVDDSGVVSISEVQKVINAFLGL